MIEAKDLTMLYGQTLALDQVSFQVKEKEVVGLLGPNGAGKTTLMRILTTFLYPTRGTALINGVDITEDPLSVRKMIGYLPETPPLYMDMRVDDFIDFVGRARGLTSEQLKERTAWVIEAVKISSVWKHMISELSLGFRQRVGLAQALIHDPQLLILDEPTAGLDPMQIIGIRQLIRELAREKTIIFSTHILQEASAVSDRLMIIDQGKIIAQGTVEELKKQKTGAQSFSVGLKGNREEVEAALRSIEAITDVKFLDQHEDIVRFLCTALSYDDAVLRLNQLTNQRNWSLNELSCRDISLEELFLGLFNQGEKNGE